MRLFARRLLATLSLLSTLSQALPTVPNLPGAVLGRREGADSAAVAGAIYFISNDPSGNYILSHDIALNGTVSFARATYAGGVGLHSIDAPEPTGPDGLYSQGVLRVVGKYLYVVNPGSNTVAMFSIDMEDPSYLTLIGEPAQTGFDWPVSLAVDPYQEKVCVANGGQQNGIQCFAIDKSSGLTPLANTHRPTGFNLTTPATGFNSSLSDIVFSSDGNRLIVAVKGLANFGPGGVGFVGDPGYLISWDVSALDGSLSKDFVVSPPAEGALNPFSLTLIAGTDAVINTDPILGYSIFDFSNAAATNGVASATITAIPGEGGVCWCVWSAQTGNYYLVDSTTNNIYEVEIDTATLTGSLVGTYLQQSGGKQIDADIAPINGKEFLYILAPELTTVEVVAIKGPGKAENLQQYNFSAATTELGLTIDMFNLQGMASFSKRW